MELGNAAADVPGCLGDIYEEFEKEDMSEMFRRAFLEQMDSGDDNNRQVLRRSSVNYVSLKLKYSIKFYYT